MLRKVKCSQFTSLFCALRWALRMLPRVSQVGCWGLWCLPALYVPRIKGESILAAPLFFLLWRHRLEHPGPTVSATVTIFEPLAHFPPICLPFLTNFLPLSFPNPFLYLWFTNCVNVFVFLNTPLLSALSSLERRKTYSVITNLLYNYYN